MRPPLTVKSVTLPRKLENDKQERDQELGRAATVAIGKTCTPVLIQRKHMFADCLMAETHSCGPDCSTYTEGCFPAIGQGWMDIWRAVQTCAAQDADI
jgi:hypothetical protein